MQHRKFLVVLLICERRVQFVIAIFLRALQLFLTRYFGVRYLLLRFCWLDFSLRLLRLLIDDIDLSILLMNIKYGFDFDILILLALATFGDDSLGLS